MPDRSRKRGACSPRHRQDEARVPIVLNAIAARALGFAGGQGAVGAMVLLTGYDGKLNPERVVNIAPALRFRSLRDAPSATAYEVRPSGSTLSVRAARFAARASSGGGRRCGRGNSRKRSSKVSSAKDIFAANYAEEARIAKLLAVATGIALAIAALGTYVLSAHRAAARPGDPAAQAEARAARTSGCWWCAKSAR